MNNTLLQYADVFATELPKGVPQDRGAFETIPLELGAVPPFRSIYRLSPLEKEEVAEQIGEVLAKYLIEPSLSPFWCTNPVCGKERWLSEYGSWL